MKEEFLEMREIEELVKKGKISLTNVIKTQKLTMEFCRDYVLDKDNRYCSTAIKIVGLIPFAITPSWLGRVVVVNGIIYHGMRGSNHRWWEPAMYFDIVCNVIMIIYVNVATAAQPVTAVLSAISTVAFLLNSTAALTSRPVASAVLHVSVTQWFLCWALFLFE